MKEVTIKLDEKSIEILKEIEKIHVNTIINYSIRKLKNDKFYKMLVGDEDANECEIEDEEVEESIQTQTKPKDEKPDEDVMEFSW